MTTNHIDQLAEWWENAEVADEINVGDLVIEDRRKLEGGFDVWPARTTAFPLETEDRRILSRAPIPTPAWHDAVAVVATAAPHPDERRVMVKCGELTIGKGPKIIYWEDVSSGALWRSDDLRDVTPLIEQKVTDEMVKRLENHFLDSANMALPTGLARTMLTAALGLDPA